jgi:hypothetical protein
LVLLAKDNDFRSIWLRKNNAKFNLEQKFGCSDQQIKLEIWREFNKTASGNHQSEVLIK